MAETKAARSARVKLQLRDKKGRWIPMGGRIKWFSNKLNKNMSGEAIGQDGNSVLVKLAHAVGGHSVVKVNSDKVEVIKTKATLGEPSTHAPNISAPNSVSPLDKTKGEQKMSGKVDYFLDSNGDHVNIGDTVFHKKHGVGKVKNVTNGGKAIVVDYDAGNTSMAKPNLLTKSDGKEAPKTVDMDNLKPGDVGNDPNTGKMFIVSKDGDVLNVGDKVTTLHKGEEVSGVVKGIYPSTKSIGFLQDGEDKPKPKKAANTSKSASQKDSTKVPTPNVPDAPEQPVEDPSDTGTGAGAGAGAGTGEKAAESSTEASSDTSASEDSSGIPNVKDWTLVGGKKGSNPGGVYEDSEGKKWFVKLTPTDDHARNEVLATELYKAAGQKTTDLQLVKNGDKLAVAAPFENLKNDLLAKIDSDPGYEKKVQDGFAVDAWLANWDTVGHNFDNISTNDSGEPVRVDSGGALLYRAQGEEKGDKFGKYATEWDSLRSSNNPKSQKVFGNMTAKQLADSAINVYDVAPETIDNLVDKMGFDQKKSDFLKETLKARRKDIMNRAEKALEENAAKKKEEETNPKTDSPQLADWEKALLEGMDTPAPKKEEKPSLDKDSLPSEQELDGYPEGSQITFDGGALFNGNEVVITKNKDGLWLDNEGKFIASKTIAGTIFQYNKVYDITTPEKPNNTEVITKTKEELDKAPVGTKITTGKGVDEAILVKIDSDTWENENIGLKFGSVVVEALANLSGISKYEEPSSSSKDLSYLKDMTSLPEEKYKDFPIGSKVSFSTNFQKGVFEKTSDDTWTREGNGHTINDKDLHYLVNKVFKATEVTLPAEATESPDVNAPKTSKSATTKVKLPPYPALQKIEALPVGSSFKTTNGGHYEKTDKDEWTITSKLGHSNPGFTDGDIHYNLTHGYHIDDSVDVPADKKEDTSSGAASESVSTKKDENESSNIKTTFDEVPTEEELAALPVGASFSTSDGYTYTKTGIDKWHVVDADGYSSDVTDKELPATMHYDKYPMSATLPGSSTANESKDTTTKVFKEHPSSEDLASLPIGATIQSVVNDTKFTYTKTDNNEWEVKYLESSYLETDKGLSGFLLSDPLPITANFTGEITTPKVSLFNGDGSAKHNLSEVVPKLDADQIQSLPAGSVIKDPKYPFVYAVKTHDGKWTLKSKTSASTSQKTTSDVPSSEIYDKLFGKGKSEDMFVSTNTSYHAIDATGKPVKYGAKVTITTGYHKGTEATVIQTNYDGSVKVVDSTGKYKNLSDAKNFYQDDTYGSESYSSSSSSTPSSTPKPQKTPEPKAKVEPAPAPEKTLDEKIAEFAGADAEKYNQEGLTFGANPEAKPNSGVTFTGPGKSDPSSPWFEKPMPVAPDPKFKAFEAPEKPKTMKWDSEEWLKAVEKRFEENPYKNASSIQNSNNWSKIQSVLDGSKSELEFLRDSKYLDDDMYNQAIKGIDEFEPKKLQAEKEYQDIYQKALNQYDKDRALYMSELKDKQDQYSKDIKEWSAANPNPQAYTEAPIAPASTENFTGGEADWTKGHIGLATGQAQVDLVKKDNAAANKGQHFLVDSDAIENMDVKVSRIKDADGNEVLEYKFKLTSPYAAKLQQQLKTTQGVNEKSAIHLTDYFKTPEGINQEKINPYNMQDSGKRYEFSVDGSSVVFQTQEAKISGGMYLNAAANDVQIKIPVDKGLKDFEDVLKNLGVTKANPSTEGDIRVLAENKLLTFAAKSSGDKKVWDGTKNFTGNDRAKMLSYVKNVHGITVDDLTMEPGDNGIPQLLLKEEKAKELVDKYGIKYMSHALSDDSVSTFMSVLTNPNNGLLSSKQRYSNNVGVGGASSSTDLSIGSGDYVFMRINRDIYSGFIIDPVKVMRRLDSWFINGDNYGKRGSSSSSLSPLESLDKHKGSYVGSNEFLLKDQVPLSYMTKIQVPVALRKEILDNLKQLGITQYNGIAIEDFVVAKG